MPLSRRVRACRIMHGDHHGQHAARFEGAQETRHGGERSPRRPPAASRVAPPGSGIPHGALPKATSGHPPPSRGDNREPPGIRLSGETRSDGGDCPCAGPSQRWEPELPVTRTLSMQDWPRSEHVSTHLPYSQQVLELFETHYDRLYCHARGVLPPAEAEDVCQRAFLALLDLEKSERMPPSPDSLDRIASELIERRCAPSRRIWGAVSQARSEAGTEARETRGRLNGSGPGPEELQRLEHELRHLPSEQRRAIRLVIGEGFTEEDASHLMGVPTTTVIQRKQRGLQKLHERIHAPTS